MPKNEVEIVDITPTWCAILNVLDSIAQGQPDYAAMKPLLEDIRRPLAMVDKINAERREKGGAID